MAQTYANQKLLNIQKSKSDKDNFYSIFNLEALNDALKLPPIAFKLWAYINSNQNGYKLALSSKDACATLSISRTGYNSAVKDLIENGYLQKQEDGTYNFYETVPDEVMVVEVHKAE